MGWALGGGACRPAEFATAPRRLMSSVGSPLSPRRHVEAPAHPMGGGLDVRRTPRLCGDPQGRGVRGWGQPTTARMSRADRISRSSPPYLTSVPPYLLKITRSPTAAG